MKNYPKTAVPLGIGLSLVLVVGAAVLSFRNLMEQREDAAWVTHTHVVIERMENLRSEVLKVENARRGYVLTGDEQFLTRLATGREEIEKSQGALRALTADNPAQQKHLEDLQPMLRARLELLEKSVAAQSEDRADKAQQAALTLPGAELTAKIMQAIDAMEGEEKQLLSERIERAAATGRRSRILLPIGTAVTIALIMASFVLLRREVKERARAEEEVNRFFDVSADLLCVAGADGYFKRVNPMWEKVLGFPVAELLARPYIEFIHLDDVAETKKAAATSAAKGIEAFENRYRTREGGYRWLNWNASADPERGLIYAAARDVTEAKRDGEKLKRLNTELDARARKLEETNRELEAFTSSVAHDLRAPLRHVDGFSRILEEEYGPNLSAEGRQLVGRVRRATQHMGELVDDLLNLSRVSRRELAPLVTDLNPLVRDVIAGLQSACQGRRVEFRVGALPFAECDPGLMRQVFANLLANAVKFTRPRDPAIIEVGQADYAGERTIFVRDNGVGFSMKYADKLFGVFQRLHRAEDFEGTGVGLVTVQRIVQKHNGRIWAAAEVDRGATFYFTLEGLEERRSSESPRLAGGVHA